MDRVIDLGNGMADRLWLDAQAQRSFGAIGGNSWTATLGFRFGL